MERKNQWDELLQESREYPDSLQKTVEKLQIRVKKEKYNKLQRTGLLAAAVVLLFVILVNTSTVFAKGVSNIPVLSSLAKLVTLNKSLQNAVENDYVQEVNLSAASGNITLEMPYIIVDDKNLVVFYKIPENIKAGDEDRFNIAQQELRDAETGKKIVGYSFTEAGISAQDMNKNNGLIYSRYYFSETKIPESLELTVSLEIEHMTYTKMINETNSEDAKPQKAGQNEVYNAGYTFEKLGTFTYPIKIDTAAIAPPKTFNVEQGQTAEGQKFTVKEVNIYPTGTEIYITFSEDNTAWIKSFELEVFSENNEVLKGANGISSVGGGDTGWIRIFIESNYFNTPKKQFLKIKGLRFINKNEEYVTVDLNQKTITPQIEGLKLAEVKKAGETAHLTFETESKDGFGMFDFDYKDSSGHSYFLNGEGTSVNDHVQQTFIDVIYPEDGIIVLKRSLSPMTELNSPIVIPLNP